MISLPRLQTSVRSSSVANVELALIEVGVLVHEDREAALSERSVSYERQ